MIRRILALATATALAVALSGCIAGDINAVMQCGLHAAECN